MLAYSFIVNKIAVILRILSSFVVKMFLSTEIIFCISCITKSRYCLEHISNLDIKINLYANKAVEPVDDN